MASSLRGRDHHGRGSRHSQGRGGHRPSGRGGSNSRRGDLTDLPTDTTTPWLAAIQASTMCLFETNDDTRTLSNTNDPIGRDRSNGRHRDRQSPASAMSPSVSRIESSLAYLDVLRDHLTAQPSWDVAPDSGPPPFRDPSDRRTPEDGKDSSYSGEAGVPIAAGKKNDGHRKNAPMSPPGSSGSGNEARNGDTVGLTPRPPPPPSLYSSSNPYASIYTSDDDEDSVDDDYDEAGDIPVLMTMKTSTMAAPDDDGGGGGMANELDTLRLLVRLHTSQSDLHARRARILASDGRWMDGAAALQSAIGTIRTALAMTDSEISRCLQRGEAVEDDTHAPTDTRFFFFFRRTYQLQQDADIVHVSTQFVVQEQERYVHAARLQVDRLNRALRPQWKKRDAIKGRIGEDRWRANPSPKQHYAKLRVQQEEELRLLQKALQQLEMEDTTTLQESARRLKERLRGGHHAKNRYNGIRPSSAVPRLEGYPDAAANEYGWTYTGSSDDRVEFFEKHFVAVPSETNPQRGDAIPPVPATATLLVKLDFYCTTGTVKTSLDHPRQGQTQLFAKQVSPDLYRQILLNPRAHTNVRYQKK